MKHFVQFQSAQRLLDAALVRVEGDLWDGGDLIVRKYLDTDEGNYGPEEQFSLWDEHRVLRPLHIHLY